MSERLTRRMSDGTAVFAEKSKSFYSAQIYEESREKNRQILDRLCDLEDKIEQGKIVELPCKVGQIVYEVQPMRARTQVYEITTGKWNGHYWWFTWVVKDRKGIYGNVDGFSSHQIGKTVFLDRAEAEAKLKGADDDSPTNA